MRAVALALLLAAGCASPILSENTALGCANGLDDDGNGLIDCADPACADSGVCEVTAEKCNDGIDEDGNGLTDCQDPSCQRAGACDAFPAASCTIRPQSGCPVGMGCYARFTGDQGSASQQCRLAGKGTEGTPCDRDSVDALMSSDAHPCAAGWGCNVLGSTHGMCGSYCNSDDDCPVAGSICSGAGPKLCTTPCDPTMRASICPQPAYACISLHEIGLSFASGGARWMCLSAALAVGTAPVGAACDDPPNSGTPASRICQAQLACVPKGTTGSVCALPCNLLAPSCPTGTCNALYPSGRLDGTKSVVLGVCL